MMDYLAEVTMSLLARARMKDAAAGYAPDCVAYLEPVFPTIAQKGVRIVSNGGGVNPLGCKRALEAIVAKLGLDLRVAIVEGDDVIPLIEELRTRGVREAFSGRPLPPRLLTANAYLGALPIKAALDGGADIVITGRCADSALALGVLMHEFGWAADDYDRLAAGSLVGHLLECGPQATGGTFSDWATVPDWHNIGYPIAECGSDGRFVISKPDATGGLIVPGVIAEQTLYEIGDPAAYLLPDVTADFSEVRLTQVGPDAVDRWAERSDEGGANGCSLDREGAHALPTTRHSRFLRDTCRGARCRGLVWRAITNPRIPGSFATARRGASQPRGAGTVRQRTWIGRIELRARNDRHLSWATEADARCATVHILSPQKRTGTAQHHDRRWAEGRDRYTFRVWRCFIRSEKRAAG